MFVQLSKDDCNYLLALIADMDADTPYTARQRGFTVPTLTKIANDPRSARLKYQDVEYLLDLLEDDELPETEQSREMAKAALEEIQDLQAAKQDERRSIAQQRESRRARRQPEAALAEHFQRTE